MANIFHVLNGDSIRPSLADSGLEGDHMVWREMLVDGPALYPLLTEQWFSARGDFIREAYGFGESGIQESSRVEFMKLRSLEDFDEIVLWFEFDLFCQINMIAALSVLQSLGWESKQISLICPGSHPEIADFRGLGQLNGAQFGALFSDRQYLSQSDIDFADAVYQAYAGEDPRVLRDSLNHDFPAVFPYLKTAIRNHLDRFPQTSSGLSREETEILTVLRGGLASRHQWVGKLLQTHAWRGYGDLQYFYRIKRLKRLYVETAQNLDLNTKGEAVLAGQDKITLSAQWLGGAKSSEWGWEEGQLIPQE